MRTVWDIPNNKDKSELKLGSHPTQKPLRISERIILTTSKPNDIVLIPFCGSGTECVAALKTNRNFIAFEMEKKYVDLSNKRIDETKLSGKQTKLV